MAAETMIPLFVLSEIGNLLACAIIVVMALAYHGFHTIWQTTQKRDRDAMSSIPNHQEMMVLVTGCDSGFGRLLVEHLHETTSFGAIVALTLTPQAAKQLENSHRLVGLQCNVTKEKDVENMKIKVTNLCRRRGLKLYAIVNNAGSTVGNGSCLFFNSPEPFIQNTQVNYFGMLRVTFALQELMVTSHCNGRIINMSSTAGTFPIPSNAAYNASKHAVEAWSDTMRTELQPFGVQVVKIRPGNFGTGMYDKWKRELKTNYAAAPPAIRTLYGEDSWIQAWEKAYGNPPIAGDPMEVVQLITQVLMLPKPKASYWMGLESKIFFRALHALPEPVRLDMAHALFVRPVQQPLDKDTKHL
jgi:NAD(P)-dependent dehydrogenase (short-subunit alcohol dehydrogenase family)